jgi:(1->4)-alpha-D-glucan 1-alpha-D-glucosylmutase
MVKSMREAKVHSSWAAPDPEYEEATLSFVGDALNPSRAGNFLASFLPFVERVAELGAHNTVIQTVLKLTLPGVPDIYQGTELWDLSMVDPDNRRPVDYALRKERLSRVLRELGDDRRTTMHKYAKAWRDGGFKLAVTATLLAYRREHAALFEKGKYQSLEAQGNDADRVCAFLRSYGEDVVLTAVARFPSRGTPVGMTADSVVGLPESLETLHWYDLISGLEHSPRPPLTITELFSVYPAAVLVPVICR